MSSLKLKTDKKTTLVVYTFHQYTDNVRFFVQHGLYEDDTIDFVIVINNPTFIIPFLPKLKNVKILNRENIGHDFGGWSYALFNRRQSNIYLYEKYEFIILINSSVRGPFIPPYFNDKWTKIFTNLITSQVKLAGTTLGIFRGKPHIQSMVLVMDRVGLDIGIRRGIFSPDIYSIEREKVIEEKEIGFSLAIIEAGYNIGSILKSLQGYDFRKINRSKFNEKNFFPLGDHKSFNPLLPSGHLGISIHPYDVIFIKDNFLSDIVSRYTSWCDFNDKTILDRFIT